MRLANQSSSRNGTATALPKIAPTRGLWGASSQVIPETVAAMTESAVTITACTRICARK